MSLLNRKHRQFSIFMEVLIRLPFDSRGALLAAIAEDLFDDAFKIGKVKMMLSRLCMTGHDIQIRGQYFEQRTYINANASKKAWLIRKGSAYYNGVYATHHLPKIKRFNDWKVERMKETTITTRVDTHRLNHPLRNLK